MTEPLLLDHLSAVVPLLILDLERQGGVFDWQIEAIQERRHAYDLAPDEAIQYRSQGTAKMIHELCEELAIMAFVPGGVKFGPLHFEGKPAYEEAAI